MSAVKKVIHTSANTKHLESTYLLILVLLDVDAAGDIFKTIFIALGATVTL